MARVVARCLARNTACARVLEKAGMVHEGRLLLHVVQNARYEDMRLYGCVLGVRAPG